MQPTTDTLAASGSCSSSPRRLVVVIGPIASGKSTLAAELAGRLRSEGEAVAVVGLDTIAEMALPTLDDWTWAHDIHGQVVGAWLASPMATVIAEGLETQAEVEQVLRHVPRDVSVFTVLLVTRYETALRRTATDPMRGISKDPDFLRKMYQRFNDGLSVLAYDLRLDSEESASSILVARVVAALKATHRHVDEQPRGSADRELIRRPVVAPLCVKTKGSPPA